MSLVLRENTIYKIVSIALAILLWLYLTASGSSLSEKNYTLNIEYLNLNEELVLVDRINTVDFRLRADEKTINSLNERDLKAVVDVGQITVGDYILPIKITKPLNTEITDIYPKQAKIELDRIAEKQVPVLLALLGETAHGYSSFKATVKPSHVLLRGPETILETVVAARAEVNLASAQTNLALNLPIKVQDQWGNFYNENVFSMSPGNVEVFVPIVSDTPSKTVAVKVVLEGTPATNYYVLRTIVEPETVQILGSQNTLDKVDLIQSRPVAITGIKENKITEVELIAPNGVTFVNEQKVKVIVQVEEDWKEKELETKLLIKNLGQNYELFYEEQMVKVHLQGSANQIDNLVAEEIESFLDLDGLEVGKYEIDVQAAKTGGLEVIRITPQKIKVEIKEKQKLE